MVLNQENANEVCVAQNAYVKSSHREKIIIVKAIM